MTKRKVQTLHQFNLPEGFRGRSSFIVQLWWIFQSTIFACSPQFMYKWRVFLLRSFGARVGDNVLIRPSARITFPWKVRIGNDSWIGDDVVIYSLGDIDIGNDVVISQRSYICSATHDHSTPSFDMLRKAIKIEDQSWLATDVFVGPGVSIGEGAVIGARSSVFKDVPAYTVSIGSPCIVISDRN